MQIWRVHVLWGKNWKISALPCLLTVLNLGQSRFSLLKSVLLLNAVFVVSLVFAIVDSQQPRHDTVPSGDDWSISDASAMDILRYPCILATTLLCTALIAFRILYLGGVKTRYWRNVQIIIESALIYVIVLAAFLPYLVSSNFTFSMPVYIFQSILAPISVRVCHCVLLSDRAYPSTIGDVSYPCYPQGSTRSRTKREEL
jgi:hypothetical protein